ncbi:hypothetical protein BP6252_01240 [Coleophoma cylindrospora]|uniref:U4/U6.U5 small nuclear ribonucleoprotein 27kDa protein domain-containing protein n=1 Tax=Coleophoma cylindrospora TaxID=1849047 RepID=A0A3D8STW7_9HELO|nr:hypothetical protein BP6252_01240 [Coleophoma cylindrospora]
MADSTRRSRRPDSKQMWDESERRAPGRERGEREEPRDRRDDRRDDRDRNRRYRSRSPRGFRDSRGGRDRDRGSRRDDPRDFRDGRDRRDDRGDDRRAGDRGRYDRGDYSAYSSRSVDDTTLVIRTGSRANSSTENGRDRDSRDKPRDHERDRSREDRRRERASRSRSPRGGVDHEREGGAKRSTLDIQKDEELTKSRTATPPVSFKVGGSAKDEGPLKPGQDHDRMEMDEPIKTTSSKRKQIVDPPSEDEDDIVVEDDGLAAMQAMMGFGGFGTTHQKKVAGNDISAVRKEKKTEYRQYMNRVGGFNRPLDEI